MTSRLKTILAFGVLALLVSIVAFKIGVISLEDISYLTTVFPGLSQRTMPMPKATGDIDGVVNSLIKDSTAEMETIKSEETDADLIRFDSQEIGDFAQTYDENEL
jgi:hypothetical protein